MVGGTVGARAPSVMVRARAPFGAVLLRDVIRSRTRLFFSLDFFVFSLSLSLSAYSPSEKVPKKKARLLPFVISLLDIKLSDIKLPYKRYLRHCAHSCVKSSARATLNA